MPGLTDDADTFEEVCSGFRRAGVTWLAAGILFLRPAVSHSIRRNLQHEPMQERLLTAFHEAERLSIHAENSTVMVLPACARLAIFERLKRVAARHRIEVAPCACKNPDIASGCCHIAGDWSKQTGDGLQPNLF